MYVLIAGGGKVGYYLTKALMVQDQEVVLIEKNKVRVDQIIESLGEVVLWGDACDPQVLQDAGVGRADTVVAITGDDEDNLVIAQMAKRKFNVPFTVARVNNPRNDEIFKLLGIDATVSSTNVILGILEDEIAYKGMMSTLAIKKGQVEIIETTITRDSPALGRPLRDLVLPPQSNLALVMRNNDIIIPNGDTMLLESDTVIALVRADSLSSLKTALVGDL